MVSRGEVYFADLGNAVGHEQSGRRPVVVVSAAEWLASNPPVVSILPLTSVFRAWPTHLEIEAGTSGLAVTSYAKCEDIRAVSPKRFETRLGAVDSLVLLRIESVLRRLLAL